MDDYDNNYNSTLLIHGSSRLSEILEFIVGDKYDKIYKFVDIVHIPSSARSKSSSIISTVQPSLSYDYISSIGYKDMKSRAEAFNRMISLNNISPINIIHPSAFVANTVDLGKGNVIFPGVVIEDGAKIGNNNIIWSNSTVCHDSMIGSHNFLASSSVVGGYSQIGDCSFLGFGSIINDHLSVASHSFLASGSVLINSLLEQGKRICGVPANEMIN